MTIIAIDPGTESSGYVKVTINENGQFELLEKGIVDNEELVKKLREESKNEIDTKLLIEGIASYGMPVGETTFETCFWIGQFMETFKRTGKTVELLYKKTDINTTICLTSNVKDTNVRTAVIDMFPRTGGGKTPAIGTKKQPGPLHGVIGHMWSALAVSITYLLKNNYILNRKIDAKETY